MDGDVPQAVGRTEYTAGFTSLSAGNESAQCARQGCFMAKRETLRDYITGELDADLIRQRQSAGWRMVAVEWERETSALPARGTVEVPYGMRVSRDWC